MAKTINLFTTIKGSLLEGFYPAGWDLRKMDRCCALGVRGVMKRQKFWHADFKPAAVKDVGEMDRRMGDAIADQIEQTRRERRLLAIILPVGPMGMYATVVKRLKQRRTACDHVTTFNMDEWSDAKGNTMPGDQSGGFQHAMKEALFEPL